MAATTSSGKAAVTLPKDNQLLITREFDAPKHLVWKAWTTPELVKRWWSGQRGETISAEIDLRVGGRWRYVMLAGEERFEVAFHGEYREIIENERLVSTEVFEGIPDAEEHASVNTLTLSESDGRTTMEILCEYRSEEDRDAVIASGMEGGMQESFDLLEEVAISLG